MGEVVHINRARPIPKAPPGTDPFLIAFCHVHGLNRAAQELQVQLGVFSTLLQQTEQVMGAITEGQ